MERCEVDNNPLVIVLQPLHSLELCIEFLFRWAGNAAELGHETAKGITEMRGKVVHYVVDRFRYRQSFHMALEYIEEGFGGVVGMALERHFSIRMLKKGKDIQRPVADVFEFLEALLHGVGLQIGNKAHQDLNTGALVEKEQLIRRITIEFEKVLHLWKEVGVSDVKEVA